MVREFGPRIHFAHLRNITREPDGSFHEADHLGGSTDMPAVVIALLEEQERRIGEKREDWQIPLRPDHGHLMADDIDKERINPGYSLIGRLRGLAELRGVMQGVAAERRLASHRGRTAPTAAACYAGCAPITPPSTGAGCFGWRTGGGVAHIRNGRRSAALCRWSCSCGSG